MEKYKIAFSVLIELKKKFVGSGDDHDRFQAALNALAEGFQKLAEEAEVLRPKPDAPVKHGK